eukprot:4436957-Pleurochrysis_carterae.AAC.2
MCHGLCRALARVCIVDRVFANRQKGRACSAACAKNATSNSTQGALASLESRKERSEFSPAHQPQGRNAYEIKAFTGRIRNEHMSAGQMKKHAFQEPKAGAI